MLRTEVLKYNLNRMYEGDSSDIKVVSGGDDNASKGYLVPLKSLSELVRLGWTQVQKHLAIGLKAILRTFLTWFDTWIETT